MVEIDRVRAYVVRIYSNEPQFEEPHVHIWRAGCWVKVSIPAELKAARILGISRKQMPPSSVIEAVRIVEDNAAAYLSEYKRLWNERYGKKIN